MPEEKNGVEGEVRAAEEVEQEIKGVNFEVSKSIWWLCFEESGLHQGVPEIRFHFSQNQFFFSD